MKFVTEYETCALIFLIIVAIRFFIMRKFPSKSNRLFGVILCFAIADLALDIIGAHTIHMASGVPLWINYLINGMFYSLQIIFPAMMLTYVFIMCGRSGRPGLRALFYIPAAFFEALLIANPFNRIVFSFVVTPEGVNYLHGPVFAAIYIGSIFYMITTVIYVLIHRKSLRRIETFTIIIFNCIIVAAMLLQFFFRDILLTGVAISISIMLMFFTMQNPETMLDTVSGVFNHAALNEYLRARISDKEGVWMMAVDIGGLRRVNSSLGIQVGNKLLEDVGSFFINICGSKSIVFRSVGTRFIFFSSEEATHRRLTELIGTRFRLPWLFRDCELSLIATVRYCEEISYFTSPEDVINLLDLAYSGADGADFGTVKPIGGELLTRSKRIGQIEDALRRALSTGTGFCIKFQPLYNVSSDCFTNAEVLLRLNDPEMGAISPAEFIPVAERTGLIHQIDSLVLELSCSFLKRHPELADTDFGLLEVNLSAAEFYNDADEYAATVLDTIHSLEHRICFEVTETAATTHRDILSSFMHTLIRHGVNFALDDFGTGYANITQIINLPFSTVKLDRTFIVSGREKDRIILADLVKMFYRTGMNTVIEGVETHEQSEIARSTGVDQIQGFLYSRPLSEEDFVSLMINGTAADCLPDPVESRASCTPTVFPLSPLTAE